MVKEVHVKRTQPAAVIGIPPNRDHGADCVALLRSEVEEKTATNRSANENRADQFETCCKGPHEVDPLLLVINPVHRLEIRVTSAVSWHVQGNRSVATLAEVREDPAVLASVCPGHGHEDNRTALPDAFVVR